MKRLLLIIIGIVALATPALASGPGASFGDASVGYKIVVIYGLVMAVVSLIMAFKVISFCERFVDFKYNHEESMKRITEILEEIKKQRS